MAACNICCEDYTLSTRKKIGCPYCDHAACLTCVKRFMLSLTDDPVCMSCKHPWTHDFIDSVLPRTWLDSVYKAHRENILYEREMALMPATQPIVERLYEQDRLKKEYYALNKQKKELVQQIDALARRIRQINMHKTVEDTRTVFVRACTKSGCKGFLSDQWKCGLCTTTVCSKCHMEKDGDEHVCKQEDVETATMLSKDSKPCPSCASMIFKIDGCDQMFCTMCHTAFCWKTGSIVRANIHNPHYYDWVRANNNGVVPREPGDRPCNENELLHIRNFPAELYHPHRLVSHIQWYEMRQYQVPQNMNNNNQHLRINFMMNAISQKQLKQQLQVQERARRKKHSIYQVLEMFYTVSKDLLNSVPIGQSSANDTVAQIKNVAAYANTQLYDIHKRFKCVVPHIRTDKWEVHPYYGENKNVEVK